MMIYMTHPQHGAMHVYAEAEAVDNEKNGWVRVVSTELNKAPPVEAAKESPEVTPTLTLKRGPGRPKKE